MNAPRLARWLLHVCTPRALRDDTLGDLEETYRRRAAVHRTRAWFGAVFDALLIGVAMCWRRVSSIAGVAGVGAPRGGLMPDTVDARLALRLMRRQPLMTLTATVALTLGIAVATVGFALVEAMLFSSLPFDGGDRFVLVQATREPDGNPVGLSSQDSLAVVSQATALEHLGGITGSRENITLRSGQVVVATVAGLTPSTWAYVPHTLIAGRPLATSDAVAGATPVALVREGFWQGAMAGQDDVVNASISIGGRPHTVVGVLPDSVKFPNTPDVWTTVDEGFLAGRSAPAPGVRLLGVLAPEASFNALQTQLTTVAPGLEGNREAAELRLTATTYTDLGPMGRDLSIAAVVVVLAVLLVIAANVGNLILARSLARSREFALRVALGASRGRLVMQVFVEVLLIAALAAVVGITSAQSVLRLFNGMDELPFWVDFTAGPQTLVVVTLAAVVAAAIAGIWPAWRATRPDLTGRIEHGGGRAGDSRFGRLAAAMVVTQIAVSIVMLHGALVVAQGFQKFTGASLDLPRNVVTSYLNLTPASDTVAGTRPVTATEVETLLRETPGVLAVGIGSALPRHSPRGVPVQIEAGGGAGPAAPRPAPEVQVSEGYFAALGARVLSGRTFASSDFIGQAPPVAVINEPFARKFFGQVSPLGQRFRVADQEEAGAWREVIGVVPDLGLSVGDESLAAGFYVPLSADVRAAYLAVQTTGDPMTFPSALREAVLDRDPTFVFNRFELLEDVAHEDRDFFKWFSAALLGLGGVTLVLALAGVYAMMSLIVTRRTREIGVRMALGASTLGVVRTILGRAAIQVAIGGVIGVVLAILSLQVRSVLVSRLGEGAAWTLPTVMFLLLCAGLAATWLPLRRALGVQAADALRSDG